MSTRRSVKKSLSIGEEDNLTKIPHLPNISEPRSKIPAHIVGHNYKYVTKNKMLADEFRLFRQSSSGFFKKFKKKKSGGEINEEAELLRRMEAQQRAMKRSKTKKGDSGRKFMSHGSMTKRESEIFFEWFAGRMDKYHKTSDYSASVGSSKLEYEIPIQYVIDDFIETQVFSSRSEAFEFLRFVDDDRNGSISIEEFASVFRDIENPDHILVMKNFIKKLESSDTFQSDQDSAPSVGSISQRNVIGASDEEKSSRHHSSRF